MKLHPFFALICVGVLFVAAVQAAPVLPTEFFGNVSINGAPAEPGTVIKAVVNGMDRGSITVKTTGKYGGTGTFDERLSVTLTEDEQKAANAPVIEFVIMGIKAKETAPFQSGNSKALDLTATGTVSATGKQGESAQSQTGQTSVAASQGSSSGSGDFPSSQTTKQAAAAETTRPAMNLTTSSDLPGTWTKNVSVTNTTPAGQNITGQAATNVSTALTPAGLHETPRAVQTKKSPIGSAAILLSLLCGFALAGCCSRRNR